MKRICGLLVIILMLGVVTIFADGISEKIDPKLNEVFSQTPTGEAITVLVFLEDQVDLDGINQQLTNAKSTLNDRHRTVVTLLQEKAQSTQGELLAEFEKGVSSGLVESYSPFWICNAIELKATQEYILAMSSRSDISKICKNNEIKQMVPAATGQSDAGGLKSPEIGLVAINATRVWNELGITGEGILVANIDTGVDGDHPALSGRWAANADPRYAGHPEWAWNDQWQGYEYPYDYHGHGTHTMGTICGGAPGDEIGVAPGAHWIAGRTRLRVIEMIELFQWLIDPDGDPMTNWDVPHVVSNSWGGLSEECDPYLIYSYIDACEAAGIVVLFAAGNDGPWPYTIGDPGNRATDEYKNCAVGAIDAQQPAHPMWAFSSRGPTICTPGGIPAIKPELTAPGVDVRSCEIGGGYLVASGTSMATPHIAGVVALIREVDPNLGVDEIKQIMYETAIDKGATGEDNDYGHGVVDAFAACSLAIVLRDTIHVPAEKPTIQDAIDFASGGESIVVAPGVYEENIDFLGKTIRVVGAGNTATGDTTFLEPAIEDDPTVLINNGEGVGTELSGFAIRNGGDTYTITIGNNASPLITNNVIYNNIICYGGPPRVDIIEGGDNIVYAKDIGPPPPPPPPACGENKVVIKCIAPSGTPVISKNLFYNNGGISCIGIWTNAYAEIINNTFDDNPRGFLTISQNGGIAKNNIVTNSDEYGIYGNTWTELDYNDVWHNNPDYYFNNPGPSDISIDPQYVNTGDQDYHLLASSHCIDAGDPDPIYNDPDGSRNDMGAYPFVGIPIVTEDLPDGPDELFISHSTPNPFNPFTKISYELPAQSSVKLDVINLLGQLVTTLVDETKAAGNHSVIWNGKDSRGQQVSSGVYFYRIQVGDLVHTKKMVLLK